MRNFFILSVFLTLLLSLQSVSFAQNKGIVGGNDDKAAVSQQPALPVLGAAAAVPDQAPVAANGQVPVSTDYLVGPNDILDIIILQPEQLQNTATVSPDGNITFPYIGTVAVKNRTLAQIQDDIQNRLSDGYMKYPVVSVSLKESHSRRFFVYGEVVKPGAYDIEENMTVLRGISIAGGFSQFGSASRVKVLRPKKGASGYEVIKVNIADVMNGVADADPAIEQGDIIVVSEGIF